MAIKKDTNGTKKRKAPIRKTGPGRKKAVCSPHTGDDKYRRLFNNAAIGIFHSTLDGKFIEVNPTLARMMGYDTPGQLVSAITDIAGQVYADPQKHDALAKRALAAGGTITSENRYRRRDGTVWHGLLHLSVILDEQGRPHHYEGFVEDIAERKQVEDALRESRARFQSFFEQSNDGITVADLEGRYVMVNPVFCRMTGYSREELLSMRVQDLLPEHVELSLFKQVSIQKMSGQREIELRRKDGSRFFAAISGSVLQIGERQFVHGIVQDITERKKIQEALQASEGLLHSVVESSADAIFIKDTQGRYELMNSAGGHLLGKKPEEALGRDDTALFLPEDAARILAQDRHIIDSASTIMYEHTVTLAAGPRVMQVRKGPVLDRHKRVIGVYGISRDITERKRGEESLRENQEKFLKIFQQAPLLITLSEIDTGKLLDVNEKFLEVSGFARDEIIGRTVVEIGWISADDRARMIRTRREQGRISAMELSLRRKDGKAVICLYSGETITVNGQERLLSIAQDITERKLAESRLRESEDKFRSIFEQAIDGIMIADPAQKRNIEANQAICRMLGFTRDELLALRIEDTHPAADLPRVLDLFGKQLRGELSLAPDIPMVRKDGSIVYVDINATPVTLGGRQRLIGIFRDITERKKMEASLRESEQRYHTLFDQSPDGIVLIDTGGKILEFNNNTHLQLGYSREEFAQLSLAEIDPVESPEEIQGSIRQVLKTGRAVFDVKHRTKQGEVRDVNVITQVVTLSGKQVMYAIWHDITERKQTEQALAISAVRYRGLFEDSPISLWEEDITELHGYFAALRSSGVSDFRAHFTDHPGEVLKCVGLVKIVSVNKATLDLYEAPDQATLLQGLSQIFAAQSLDTFREIMIALAEGAQVYECECVNQTLAGRPLNVLLRWTLLASDQTDRSRALITIVDITERKLAETAIREREKQLAESQRIAHVGSWEHNLTTGKVVWSDELFRIMGLDPRKDPGDFKMFFDMIHPEDQPVLKKGIEETVKTGKHFSVDYRFILRDGTTRILHAQAELIHDETGTQNILSGTGQDITERKMAEEKIQQSEAKYRNLFESSTDGIFITDLDGNFIDLNSTAYMRLGYTKEELLSLHVSKLHHPTFAPRIPGWMAEIRGNGKALFESAHLRKDGTAMPVEVSARLIDFEGRMVFFSIIRDITARKEAEEKLRQNEKFIQGILDTVDEGFIVIDKDYRILTANKGYCGQVARACDDIIGRHCYEISHHHSRPCYEEGEECAVRQTFTTGEPHAALHKHSDGEHVLYVETKAYPIKNASGNVTSVIETINNITEKHLLEEERLKTQKLESIGTLAGGIAHDFNNLLQGVFGYISMAKMTFDQKEKSLAMLGQAEKALHQSVNLTTQLLTFSKGGKPVMKTIALQPVIENAVKFALSGSRTTYQLRIEPGLRLVEADEGQIAQVVQNIALNADQAMPLGGSVAISARNVPASDASLPQELNHRDAVLISIQDSGVGIPEQYLSRIFDPYFTTKEKGSGLGLATSYSIIRNHGGLIRVRSQVGKGTTFSIYLPASTEHAEELKSPAIQAGPRTGRVLVMDDEEMIRMVAKEMLRSLGHEVDFADKGETAIDLYQAARDAGRPFDIVILDLTIRGGMGGLETMQKLMEIDPQVKAVVSSGYSDNAAMASYRAQGFRAFLKKPYNMQELQDLLQDLLG